MLEGTNMFATLLCHILTMIFVFMSKNILDNTIYDKK